jgi:hypothetical protein
MSVQDERLSEAAWLVEELAEATLDTVEMLLAQPHDEDWASHARYLQDLHRLSQSVLARMATA